MAQQAISAYAAEHPLSKRPDTVREVKDQCPMCLGIGWLSPDVPVSDKRYGKFIPCDCSAHLRAERLQALSGLTPDERRASLDDIIPTGGQTDVMLLAARKFVSNPSGLLTIHGGSGNAKTLLLQAVVNECLNQQIEAVYVLMKDLVDYVREGYRSLDRGDHDGAVSRLNRFQRVRVLAIDEFDKVKPTDWVSELETAMIDRRYRDGLAGHSGTLIVMNKWPESMPDHISSRLRDGRNVVIKNNDSDMRGLMQ